jgi:hypothetical protein
MAVDERTAMNPDHYRPAAIGIVTIYICFVFEVARLLVGVRGHLPLGAGEAAEPGKQTQQQRGAHQWKAPTIFRRVQAAKAIEHIKDS